MVTVAVAGCNSGMYCPGDSVVAKCPSERPVPVCVGPETCEPGLGLSFVECVDGQVGECDGDPVCMSEDEYNALGDERFAMCR